MKKNLPIFIFILSILFLIPGVTQPLMTIKATINKQEMLGMGTNMLFPAEQSNNLVQNLMRSVLQQINLDGTVEVFESTRSLIGTMSELISHDHIIVGLLIGLFGIIIPLIKIILIIMSEFTPSLENKTRLLKISSLLSKWSMSDVFVMAIIVAFMAINTNEQSIAPIEMNAELGMGFYYFAIYCLLAITANLLLEKKYSS